MNMHSVHTNTTTLAALRGYDAITKCIIKCIYIYFTPYETDICRHFQIMDLIQLIIFQLQINTLTRAVFIVSVITTLNNCFQ